MFHFVWGFLLVGNFCCAGIFGGVFCGAEIFGGRDFWGFWDFWRLGIFGVFVGLWHFRVESVLIH
jgi:hypothetical protein